MCRTHSLVIFFVLGVFRLCACDLTTVETTTDFYEAAYSTAYSDYSTGWFTYPDVAEHEGTSVGAKETIAAKCQTVPGKVYVTLDEDSGRTYATWGESLNPECNRYNVTLGNQTFIQENTTVDLGLTKDIRCTELRITPLDTQNRRGETTLKIEPGQIQNLMYTPANHVISLSWKPPEDASCVKSYKITLRDKEYTTTATKYDISDLEACTSYDGTVSAISETDDEGAPTAFTTTTTKPSRPGSVTQLKYEINGEVMNITWSPPDKMGKCITKYSVNIWDQNNNAMDYSPTVPYVVIDRVVPCKEYNIQIIANIGNTQGNNVQESTAIPAKPTAAPTIRNQNVDKTTLAVVVQLETYDSNMCKITEIIANCAFSGEEFLDWMIESSSASLPYADTTARPQTTVNIADLSEYTNYNCNVSVINSGGESEAAEFTIQTLEEVPSSPENLTWEEDESSVTISWNPPSKVPGVMGQYRISINHTNTLHYVDSSCPIEVINITEYMDERIFIFSRHLPNSEYVVNVAASTSAGFGEEAEMDFTTQPKASDEPRNVKMEFENILGDVYDASVILHWTLPCNTNGELLKFTCKLRGNDTEHEQKDIVVNEDISNHSYSVKFKLKPLYKYIADIFAVTNSTDGKEIAGRIENISFDSPDGYPSAPLNLQIVEIASKSAVFQWEEPENKNGDLTKYKIHIEVGGALHAVPEGCEHNTTNLEVELGPDETQYRFTGFPNYNYTVVMQASTSAGFGLESEPKNFQTARDAPEPVRDVGKDPIIKDEEIYNVELKISFDKPCHINGQFDHYEITLNGSRDKDVDTKVKSLTGFEDTAVQFELKPEYEYTGHVKVYTDGFESESVPIPEYISPAGVPTTNITSLSELEVIDPHTANFVLERDTFDTSNGKILFYAIILSPFDDMDNGEPYNFWYNTNWPESGFWNENGELKQYQATPERWNPFQSVDQASFTYKIGTDSCDGSSYCNGKLRPDTAYHLRVRGFTSRAYRDTIPVKFITPAKLNIGALIGGIVGACCLLALIFVFGIIFWRRRRKEKTVDEEDPFENPMIPSPIAVKAFVDHYNDYKTNLNKLKSEYTLLERKSAEQQLPASFALTDDNKRKNRYINILPYDETRVKLDRDKNDNYTDYINASYIKGYSDNIEYIATQGPLEPTVVDFWRMVIQENVSLIVMVAQFVENNKPKCHQYFPNNHETMDIGDGIEIRCATELPFEGYIKRTLLVQRELTQMTVTHLQFTEWPDFGCPNDTDSMLEFCNVMRQIIEHHKSKTIIHCSAGVGRTGTLIAIDILMQTIENKGDLDVFKTVLDLRKQRIRMVQTEKQYMFIHSCLAQHIQNPRIPENKVVDPIYENVTIKQENGGTAESAL